MSKSSPVMMRTSHGTCEIVESKESDSTSSMNEEARQHEISKPGQYSIEDDINQLFKAIDIRASARKNPMKKPMRVSSSQASKIGISESVSLKQALRGLCISQASEMAATKMRLSKQANSSVNSEAGTIKRLYKAVVIEASESGCPLDESKGNSVEISLFPDRGLSNQNEIVSLPAEVDIEKSKAELSHNEKLKSEKTSSSIEGAGGKASKCPRNSPRLLKPMFMNKNLVKKKVNPDSTSAFNHFIPNNEWKENDEVSSFDTTPSNEINPSCGNKSIITNPDETSRSREKGEFSQSSKSSIYEYSSNTLFSEESNSSGSSRSRGNRPHMSKDMRWEAIRCIQGQKGNLGLRHFKLVRKLGSGDIGTIYLAELSGTNCLFALKVMDNEFLASRKKMARAETEREILQMLDHPFLPTLYAHFSTNKHSCLVMDYCPGGDLHVLRQRQPTRNFSEQAARFYVAEVLLALEYLHMLGVVYRDLKPENILVREDGHIMLSDFDLSLICTVNPTVLIKSSPLVQPAKKVIESTSCIDPFCLQPSCFTPRLLFTASKRLKSDLAAQINPLPQLIAEPIAARSNSFVGTHEYLAPEIIKGEGHGSAVDWWTYGIFLYELLYGKTPFKGVGNDDTLANVVSQSLKFPENPIVSVRAKDLIKGLLIKEPENRLGSSKGAAEIKQHPFFRGLNWALIRCAVPPELPKVRDTGLQSKESTRSTSSATTSELKDRGDNLEFEMF